MSVSEHPPAIILSCRFNAVEPAHFALVDRFYRNHGYKVKCTRHERVFVLEAESGGFIAAVRLVPQSSGHFWLRNMLVAPEYRGHGLATRLLNEFRPVIFPWGCYCFALPHLTNLYQQMGFETHPAHCPADIKTIYDRYRSRGRDWVLMGYQQS